MSAVYREGRRPCFQSLGRRLGRPRPEPEHDAIAAGAEIRRELRWTGPGAPGGEHPRLHGADPRRFGNSDPLSIALRLEGPGAGIERDGVLPAVANGEREGTASAIVRPIGGDLEAIAHRLFRRATAATGRDRGRLRREKQPEQSHANCCFYSSFHVSPRAAWQGPNETIRHSRDRHIRPRIPRASPAGRRERRRHLLPTRSGTAPRQSGDSAAPAAPDDTRESGATRPAPAPSLRLEARGGGPEAGWSPARRTGRDRRSLPPADSRGRPAASAASRLPRWCRRFACRRTTR